MEELVLVLTFIGGALVGKNWGKIKAIFGKDSKK